MTASLAGLAHLLTAALISSTPLAPVDWSGDGRWFAYTLADSSDAPALPSDWLLRRPHPDAPGGDAPPFHRAYRVWTTRANPLESVLIDETPHPCTSPAWGSDGRSLIYGRFVSADGEGHGPRRGRYELVIRSALDRTRVLVVDPDLELDQPSRDAMPSRKPAASADGRRVATPRPGPEGGFWIVHIDGGRAPTFIEGGESPAWSPDGRHLAYLRTASGLGPSPYAAVHLMTPSGGAGRLLDVDAALTPSLLAWARDGQALLAVANPMRGLFRNTQLDLVRVPIEGGRAMRVSMLEAVAPNNGPRRTPAPPPPGEALKPPSLTVEVAMDGEQAQGVCLVEVEGLEQMMKWGDLQTHNTLKRFHPLDAGLRIAAPSLPPTGPTLAFRVDDSGGSGLVALMDLNTEEITLIAPDAAARRRWLDRLAACAVAHLQEWLPEPEEAGVRATILPIMGELGGFHPRPFQLKRLARFAAGPLDSPPPEPGDGLDEFRLFFAYLGQDFAAAERAIQPLESGAGPEDRLRWLCLRAQILLSQGKSDRSQGLLDYLDRETRPQIHTLVEDGAGFTLQSTPRRSRAWVEHLGRLVVDGTIQKGRAPSLDPDAGPEAESNAGAWDFGLPNLPFAPRPGPPPVAPPRIDGPPPMIRHPDNFDQAVPGLVPRVPPPDAGLRIRPMEFELER